MTVAPAEALRLLIPPPRRAELLGRSLLLTSAPAVVRAGGQGQAAARRLERAFAQRSLAPDAAQPAWVLRIDDTLSGGAEAYRLRIDPSGVELVGASDEGLFRAATTLAQWIRLQGGAGALDLPGLRVEDAPDLAQRGVMLDVSRDRVPTLETLLHLVDLFADWKVNQLQLYLEHAFAYEGHEVVWRDASPLTADDVRALERACAERFIELVPNQNCFGHLHRWLVHEPYRRLAECPDGVEHPFSDSVEPFSLCPSDPGSRSLVADLLGQLVPLFASRRVNAGLDETFDLGKGRSREDCERRGRHRVYLDWVREVRSVATGHGRRMQMWGDIVLEAPELIPELPSDIVPLVWGYEAAHPFAEQAARFEAAGFEYLLCPGTSSWNSFAGRTANMIGNVTSAAAAAAAHGAAGLLTCDWGDFGHLQPWPVALPGLLAGAAAAWATSVRFAGPGAPEEQSSEALDLAGALDRHVFRDDAGVLGQAVLQLGDAGRVAGGPNINGTPLFSLLVRPHDSLDHGRYRGVDEGSLEAARALVGDVVSTLAAARSRRDDASSILDELRWVAGLLQLGCDVGIERLQLERDRPLAEVPAARRRGLADRLLPLVAAHEPLWLARSRPGGRLDSVARLEKLVERLRA